MFKFKKVNVWVFDLDDTLIDNVHDYAWPILDACKIIIEALGSAAPHVSKIVALEEEIDSRRVKEINPATGKPFAYSMERFPGTMAELYREICRRAGAAPDPVIADRLYQVGLTAFDTSRYKSNIKPGALEVVEELRRRGDQVMLLTKGDRRVQAGKLKAIRAGDRFSRVVVVDDKSAQTFRKLVPASIIYRPISVGNDYQKDIAPALHAGYHKGVWIPVETWEVIGQLDNIRRLVDPERCVEVSSVVEILDRYDEIVREVEIA